MLNFYFAFCKDILNFTYTLRKPPDGTWVSTQNYNIIHQIKYTISTVSGCTST